MRLERMAKVYLFAATMRGAVCWRVLMLSATLLAGGNLQAARPAQSTSSRSARLSATQTIPFDQMDADGRAKAISVVKHTSIFRRLPAQVVDCDPRYFIFLVRHPEVIVNIWHKMDATDMTLKRRGPEQFYAEDGAGTVGNLEFLYGDHRTHVLFAEGSYTGPLTARPIRANCLLVLNSRYVPHENGRYYVVSQMDVFIDIKNVGVELVARTFQNMIGNATDQNFTETANFVTKLARTTEKNGPGVQRLAQQLEGVDPAVRNAFAEHAGIVYRKSSERQETSSAAAQPNRITRAQHAD